MTGTAYTCVYIHIYVHDICNMYIIQIYMYMYVKWSCTVHTQVYAYACSYILYFNRTKEYSGIIESLREELKKCQTELTESNKKLSEPSAAQTGLQNELRTIKVQSYLPPLIKDGGGKDNLVKAEFEMCGLN